MGVGRSLAIEFVFIASLASLASPQTAGAAPVTNGGDTLRTGWYPDQPGLSPQIVSQPSFGKLFTTEVTGAVLAQPLVLQHTVLVATEANFVYSLDARSGAVLWSRSLGKPFRSSDVGCGDIVPTIGITGTPVIDDVTGIAYLVAKTYADGVSGAVALEMHALSMATGAEQAGFPVRIEGTAQNDPTRVFNPLTQNQRPGLLLMDGVVYAGFGSVCDISPWAGFIAGVTTAGTPNALWTSTPAGKDGAGIWMAGSGLVSDGPGQIVFVTGNGGGPSTPRPGNSPPRELGEAIVRLQVQPDRSLKATRFFAPFNAPYLDDQDLDLGSGGVVGLPPAFFGSTPRLFVQAGKEGYVYLHDADALGGFQQGPAGGDLVAARLGPESAVYARPGVWPGERGWVYYMTRGSLNGYSYGLDGAGKPSLSLAGASSETFGFGSSAAVITSDQTSPGSALVWVVFLANPVDPSAELRAYDAMPVGGVLQLRFRSPVGVGSKFNPPGVGQNRLYVGRGTGTSSDSAHPSRRPSRALRSPSPTPSLARPAP